MSISLKNFRMMSSNTHTLRSSKLPTQKLFFKNIPRKQDKQKHTISCSLKSYEVLSHGIVYFTMFYCTFNWSYYRNIRKKIEKKNEDNDK